MPAVAFKWTDDGVMKPLRPKVADALYVIGETYWLEQEQRRSEISHRHEFAWLREAWKNLPELIASEYATPEHLRKRALILAGYYDETIIDADTHRGAVNVAVAFRARDEFAWIVVRGEYVVVRTAKSQSRQAMKAGEFQESKTKIMDIIAGMIGVAPASLEANAGRAA
jgi:hypothetical protein